MVEPKWPQEGDVTALGNTLAWLPHRLDFHDGWLNAGA
jgi:hypothetical protein